MNLKNIMLSETSHSQKTMSTVSPIYMNSSEKQLQRQKTVYMAARTGGRRRDQLQIVFCEFRGWGGR